MADAIKLVCWNCRRTMEYPRSADAAIPASVVKIVQGRCDKCWHGDHDSETWFDARGREVSQDVYG